MLPIVTLEYTDCHFCFAARGPFANLRQRISRPSFARDGNLITNNIRRQAYMQTRRVCWPQTAHGQILTRSRPPPTGIPEARSLNSARSCNFHSRLQAHITCSCSMTITIFILMFVTHFSVSSVQRQLIEFSWMFRAETHLFSSSVYE